MTTCATPDCARPTSGKSKYCVTHKAEAREAWKARIAVDAAERIVRKASHRDLFNRAHEAGMAALNAAVPTPMVVGSPTHFLGNNVDPTKGPVYFAPEGPSGFAWVNIRPATGSFARWVVKEGLGRTGYYGGVQISPRWPGQSMERKEAYCRAFAGVLTEAGLKAHTTSRMD